ncbi:prolyl oligopeptidase family serine peptidase [Bacillus carboniphilus]|uniref:Prolyl oligopeptidase family serine peptidase n=1 Tax=Bacillus carboniphilus TaxID=86663 RepID=A0ABN0VQD8_9BACI
MYYIDHYKIKDIPLLEVGPQESKSKPLPVVIFIHGFTSAKEHNLHYAYYLAEKGFRVLLPECDLHGERSKGSSAMELSLQFWNIVIKTIHELEDLHTYLVEENKLKGDSIGVAGTSMGGIITLGALTQFEWIKAAVSLMGNPSYIGFAQMQIDGIQKQGIPIPFTDEQLQAQLDALKAYDLSIQPDLLKKRPLMFWHGEKDGTVPFAHAHEFYEKVKNLYNESPTLIQFHRDPKADHKVSRYGVLKTVEWFEQHLKVSQLTS